MRSVSRARWAAARTVAGGGRGLPGGEVDDEEPDLLAGDDGVDHPHDVEGRDAGAGGQPEAEVRHTEHATSAPAPVASRSCRTT
jgi:hypothetical protein